MRSPLLALFLALAFGACKPAPPPATAAAAPPLPADVQKVAAAAAAPSSDSPAGSPASPATPGRAEFTGEFVSPVRSELASKLPGRVGKVLVDAGARVVRGQPLLELETDYLQLDVERAEAELARAAATADEAGRDLERKQGLLPKGSVSQAAFDRSQAAAQASAAARQSALAGANLARQRLRDAVLLAPIDGVVAERRADVGERLGDSSIAFVIEQVAPLKLRFRVPERYISQVRLGLPVRASVDPYPGETFAGHVSVVWGAIDPANRTFMVEAAFDNRDLRLRPGLFAHVEAELGGN